MPISIFLFSFLCQSQLVCNSLFFLALNNFCWHNFLQWFFQGHRKQPLVCPCGVASLLERCQVEDFSKRPTFHDIVQTLAKVFEITLFWIESTNYRGASARGGGDFSQPFPLFSSLFVYFNLWNVIFFKTYTLTCDSTNIFSCARVITSFCFLQSFLLRNIVRYFDVRSS